MRILHSIQRSAREGALDGKGPEFRSDLSHVELLYYWGALVASVLEENCLI